MVYLKKKGIFDKKKNKVQTIQFGVLSNEAITKLSVCEISSVLIYDQKTSLPMENGINDPRMGVTMRGIVCQTCFGDIKDCPGHFGHINLAEWFYNC